MCVEKPKDNTRTFCRSGCGSRRPTVTVAVKVPEPEPEPEPVPEPTQVEQEPQPDESEEEGVAESEGSVSDDVDREEEDDEEQEQVEERAQESAVGDVIGQRTTMYIRLTPTKKRRKMNGETTKHKQQGKCRICKAKTTYICSLCRDEGRAPEPWLCHFETPRQCYSVHLLEAHP
jgi:hypothetical protein